MKIWARKDVEIEFTNEELELLIDASLNDKHVKEAIDMLRMKLGGSGYISEAEIQYQACEYDMEKYIHVTGFCDIEWQ